MDNYDINKIMGEMEKKQGTLGNDPKNKAQVEKLLKSLTGKQAETVKNVLADPEKSKEILNSPAARALMKKLMNNG